MFVSHFLTDSMENITYDVTFWSNSHERTLENPNSVSGWANFSPNPTTHQAGTVIYYWNDSVTESITGTIPSGYQYSWPNEFDPVGTTPMNTNLVVGDVPLNGYQGYSAFVKYKTWQHQSGAPGLPKIYSPPAIGRVTASEYDPQLGFDIVLWRIDRESTVQRNHELRIEYYDVLSDDGDDEVGDN